MAKTPHGTRIDLHVSLRCLKGSTIQRNPQQLPALRGEKGPPCLAQMDIFYGVCLWNFFGRSECRSRGVFLMFFFGYWCGGLWSKHIHPVGWFQPPKMKQKNAQVKFGSSQVQVKILKKKIWTYSAKGPSNKSLNLFFLRKWNPQKFKGWPLAESVNETTSKSIFHLTSKQG